MIWASRLVLFVFAALLPFVSGVSTIYWPVINPTATMPWVIGQKNLLAWRVASDTGVQVFDIQLHNFNPDIMEGFIKIAKNVPMTRLKGGYGNFGGEIEVDLDGTVPTGDGFVVSFLESLHGEVYTISPPFSIVSAEDKPSNWTDQPSNLPAADQTATLHDRPNPTLQWAITLDGKGAVPTNGA